MTDPHAVEHDDWDHTYLADSLVLLDEGEVREQVPCPIPDPDPEPTPQRWLNRHRTGPGRVSRDR